MTTRVEQRLRAAGDELDRQIEWRACRPEVDRVPRRRAVRTFALASCSALLLIAGLVWLTGRDPGPSPILSVNDTSTVVESTDAPAVTAANAPPSTTDASTASTVPYDQRPPIAVGDSVMLGAQPQLQAGGLVVYADPSRQADQTAALIAELRAAHSIGSAIVIQVGTNGPVTSDDFDTIMSALPADEVPTVVFLTNHAPKPWIAGNNELIRELPAKYPNAIWLDWDGLATQIADELGSDGTHLRTDTAKQYYANYIFGTIGRTDLVQPLP